ncbi:hypothetical protein bcgnr5371_42070 [Bacillus cereus]|uniref:hypothetical protein n=1 Tax=Bacillus mobilis TaxID=2026190 RepID=UPI0011AA4C2A|nr:hypothetical protein [Bacillus mobilis]MED4383167.1 hypothetical protein [Bacillus mobilis]HDX9640332.1 hypothetical protein [Bacillus mobilis]
MGDINAPEFAAAKELSDFVIDVKTKHSIFVETHVQLNAEGQLFIDLNTNEDVHSLADGISKELTLLNWRFKGKEVYLYVDGREKRIILTPYEILALGGPSE